MNHIFHDCMDELVMQCIDDPFNIQKDFKSYEHLETACSQVAIMICMYIQRGRRGVSSWNKRLILLACLPIKMVLQWTLTRWRFCRPGQCPYHLPRFEVFVFLQGFPHFIPNYSKIATSLNYLSRKKVLDCNDSCKRRLKV